MERDIRSNSASRSRGPCCSSLSFAVSRINTPQSVPNTNRSSAINSRHRHRRKKKFVPSKTEPLRRHRRVNRSFSNSNLPNTLLPFTDTRQEMCRLKRPFVSILNPHASYDRTSAFFGQIFLLRNAFTRTRARLFRALKEARRELYLHSFFPVT